MIGKSSRLSSARVLVPAAIIAVSIIIFILLFILKPTTPPPKTKQIAWPVHTQVIQLSKQVPQIILHGMIKTPRHTKLETTISAFVKSTPVLSGESVKKDQLLIQLDDKEATITYREKLAETHSLEAQLLQEKNLYKADQAALSHEKNLYVIAKKEVARFKSLADQKYLSISELEKATSEQKKQELLITNRELALENHQHRLKQAQAQLDKADALLDRAKLDITRTRIIAPFAGKITDLKVSIGDHVEPGETLIEIYDPSELEVHAQIPERYIQQIKTALQNKAIIRATGSDKYNYISMALDRIGATIDQGRGTVDGIFIITKDITLPIGLSIPIVANLPAIINSISLPSESLYDGNRIYQVKSGRLEAIKVQHLGNQIEKNGKSKVIVRSHELHTGDLIVTTHLPNAITGLKVQPITQSKSDAKKSN